MDAGEYHRQIAYGAHARWSLVRALDGLGALVEPAEIDRAARTLPPPEDVAEESITAEVEAIATVVEVVWAKARMAGGRVLWECRSARHAGHSPK